MSALEYAPSITELRTDSLERRNKRFATDPIPTCRWCSKMLQSAAQYKLTLDVTLGLTDVRTANAPYRRVGLLCGDRAAWKPYPQVAFMDELERLRNELEDAFRNRAHLYRLLLEELEAELGLERATAVMARALERRGREVAEVLFRDTSSDPKAIGSRFLSVSPDNGRMYPHEVASCGSTMEIRVHRCPLKDAWFDSGLPAERIATLCRVAGAFDKGLFEAAGISFSNQTWRPERGGGCCWIKLERDA